VTPREVRACFFGDSFVAGVGDPHHVGWVGRVAAGVEVRGVAVTGYNLGIRLNTSADVRTRWRREAEPRFPVGCDNRLVLSFGVNDTTAREGGTRIAPADSIENLTSILEEATTWGWPVLVVGPAPIGDDQQNARTAALNDRFADVCQRHGVPYVEVFHQLDRDPVWSEEVRAGDGAHPAAAGYQRLAEIVFDPWATWLSR